MIHAIITYWVSDTCRFLVAKSESKNCFEEKFGKSEFWKNYAQSKISEDMVLFHLGDERVRKRASNTSMNI